MPRNYQLPGGTLTVTDQDPLEIALRRAQLEELLQKPATERAQLALQQQDLAQRGSQAASARELGISDLQLRKAQAIEQGDLAKQQFEAERAYKQGSLAEETRFHTGTLGEQKAGRESTATSARESTRAGVLRDLIGLYQPGEAAGSVPAGTVGGLLEKSGYPELNQAYGEASGRQAAQRARAQLPEYQKYTPEQRKTELAAQPEEFQSAMSKLLSQPTETAPGAAATPTPTPTATPKPPPSTTIAPIAQTSAISFNNRPIPIGVGFSTSVPRPTPSPTPETTPPPAPGVPLTELLKRKRRRGQV